MKLISLLVMFNMTCVFILLAWCTSTQSMGMCYLIIFLSVFLLYKYLDSLFMRTLYFKMFNLHKSLCIFRTVCEDKDTEIIQKILYLC